MVDPPKHTNIIGSRWTYQLKRDTIRVISCYKACLVAQGFMQTYWIDYDKTFCPVTKSMSTHVFLALAAIHSWEVHQINIENMYLNMELTEKVYMAQLPSFAKEGQEGKVCRLHKALYSLKQGRYLHVCEAFAKFGHTCCQVKQCVFYKGTQCGIIIVVVMVDNLTLVSNCPSLLLG